MATRSGAIREVVSEINRRLRIAGAQFSSEREFRSARAKEVPAGGPSSMVLLSRACQAAQEGAVWLPKLQTKAATQCHVGMFFFPFDTGKSRSPDATWRSLRPSHAAPWTIERKKNMPMLIGGAGPWGLQPALPGIVKPHTSAGPAVPEAHILNSST